MPKQDQTLEIYQARFATGFSPEKIKDARIAYGASLDNADHTGNRLIASLQLIAAQNPQHISWFIACELGYLNYQIQDNSLISNPQSARELARKKGDQLQKEHEPLLEECKKEKKVSYKILRWHHFDNDELDNEDASIFKETLAQVHFLYLLGKLNIKYDFLLKVFNLICEKKIEEAIKELRTVIADRANRDLACDIFNRVSFLLAGKKAFKMDIFSNDIKNDEDIFKLANSFTTKVNTIATNRTKNSQKSSQKNCKPFNEVIAWTNSRDYALLDTAMILTLAKTQNLDILFYPLRQQRIYQNFFEILRQLCKKYNLLIIDIILEPITPKIKNTDKSFHKISQYGIKYPGMLTFPTISDTPTVSPIEESFAFSETVQFFPETGKKFDLTFEEESKVKNKSFNTNPVEIFVYSKIAEMQDYFTLLEQQLKILELTQYNVQQLQKTLAIKTITTEKYIPLLDEPKQSEIKEKLSFFKKIKLQNSERKPAEPINSDLPPTSTLMDIKFDKI